MAEKRLRSEPMVIKYWSSAGIMLTYWCNARCESCYVCSSPRQKEWIAPDDAILWWRQLQEASPHGCRVHLTGGEPFGDYERLLEICRLAQKEGLGPLDKVETNAFWATDERVIRKYIGELDRAGMNKLGISADPYHQRYIPIERCLRLAEIAKQMLGENRVQIRWEKWLDSGCDTSYMDEKTWNALLAEYYSGSQAVRERMNGRAVSELCDILPRKSEEFFFDNDCRGSLLRSRHVHIGPDGTVLPGTCAGLVLGQLDIDTGISDIWQALGDGWQDMDVISQLVSAGPVKLMELAREYGFKPDQKGYCSKCHLCWELRGFFAERGMFKKTIAPGWMYGV